MNGTLYLVFSMLDEGEGGVNIFSSESSRKTHHSIMGFKSGKSGGLSTGIICVGSRPGCRETMT